MLQQLKTELVDVLLADPFFAEDSVPVLDERLQELDNEIERRIADLGLCVFVAIPVALVSEAASNIGTVGTERGPYFDDVTIIARVYERPILNDLNNQDGTGKTALETANTIAALWHGFRPEGSRGEAVVVQRVALGDDPQRVSVDVIARHRGGIKYTLPQVALPEITAGAEVSISCATAGAAIFYTTNGDTAPTPRTGTLYTAPFSPAGATRIRTRAWLAGYLGSKEASLTI